MKYVYAQAITPNGATVTVHRIHRVTLEQTRVLVTLNHYADADQEIPTWQDEYPMPIDRFAMGAYPDCVMEYMVAQDGLFLDGQIIDTDDSDVTNRRKMKLHEIARYRDGHIAGGVNVPDVGLFDTDKVSTENIMGAVQMAVISMLAEQPFSIDWRLADNTTVTLNAQQMVKVRTTVAAYRSSVYKRSWELKAMVNAAETVEDIDAIAFDGWPVS